MMIEFSGAGEAIAPPQACLVCPVRQFAAYRAADRNDLDTLMQLRRDMRQIAERRILLREGEAPLELATLVSGWAFRFKLLPDGRRQILSFLLPGDMIVFHALHENTLNFSVQTLTPVQVCAFDANELRSFLMDRPLIRRDLEAHCAAELIAADELVTDLGQRRAPERMARFVLGLEARLVQRKLAEPGILPFPLRQGHLADTLGLTTVHVSRMLTQLRGDGVISVGRDQLVISNRDRLMNLAGAVKWP